MKTCIAYTLALLIALFIPVACSPDVLLQDETPSSSPQAIGKAGQNTLLHNGTEPATTRVLQGEEAEIEIIRFYSEMLANGGLREKERAMLEKVQAQRNKRLLLRSRAANMSAHMADGRLGLTTEAQEAIPPGFNVKRLARRAGYPFIAFVSRKVKNQGKMQYRYAARVLQLEERFIGQALFRRSEVMRYEVRDQEGDVALYVEAVVPGYIEAMELFEEAVNDMIEEAFGVRPAAPGLSKGAGDSCEWVEDPDGTMVYECCCIIVEDERCNELDGDAECGAGGADTDPLPVGDPDPPGEGDGWACQMNCEEEPEDDAENTEVTLIEVNASLEAERSEPTNENTGSKISVSGSMTVNVTGLPSNAEDISVEMDYELEKRRKYITGEVIWEGAGFGVDVYGVSVKLHFPFPTWSGSYKEEFVQDDSFYKVYDNFEGDSVYHIESIGKSDVCIDWDVSYVWTVEGNSTAEILGANYTTGIIRLTDDDTASAGEDCVYVDDWL